MPRGHKHPHYKLHGARVSWEAWTFWHWLKGGRMASNMRRHEIRTLSIDDVDFITREPPAEGQKVLLNIYMPDEAIPYVVRGVVRRVKAREGKPEALVRVKFRSCPGALAIKIGDLADTVI